MKKRITWIAVLVLVPPTMGSAQETPDVRASVSEVTDNRTTGQFFGGFSIELNLMGSDVQDAKALRFLVEKAVDDLGTNLVKEGDEPELEEVGGFGHSGGTLSVSVDLKNPPRRAQYVKELSGTLEVFNPASDPGSTVTVPDVGKKTGSVIDSPALREAGVKLSLLTKEQYESRKEEKKAEASEEMGEEMGQAFAEAFGAMFGGFGSMGENSLIMNVEDPDQKIISIEFITETGEEIDTRSRMTMGDTMAYEFKEPLPETAKMEIHLSTDKALQRFPITVKDIALP